MANLPIVGVQLEAQGAAGFNQAIGKSASAVNQFTQGALNAVPGVRGMAAAIAGGNAIFAVASSVISGVTGIISDFITVVEQATVAMFNKAVEVQSLTLSLESLAAREQLSSGRAEDMNQALEQAVPITEDLLKQIRALDEVSPFSYDDVISVFRTNMAFGQTMQTSIKLTKAITDIAAASGQGAGIMQRLAYNFSQMSLTGQITMRDFRDLSMAGFDLARMLRETLNMSIEETNAALKSNKLTMEEVSQAFVEYADKNFGGAAKRLAETIPGVMSSFKGLFTVISSEVMGGAATNLGVALKNIYDYVSKIVNSGIFQVFGAVLEVVTGKIAAATTKIPELNDGMLDTIADALMAFIESMFDYGLGMMEALASGIIAGASAVIDAVLAIGNAIGNLLMPGSPPKILPNIDKWGAKAMLEYLRGFTEADFDVLKTVQRSISSALSITGKDKSGKMYQNFSVGLAKMLSSNQLDEGFLGKMAGSLGPYGAEIAKLTRLEFQLATATEAVNKARKTESLEMTKLQQMVYDYNRALKEGTDPEALQAERDLIDAQVEKTDAAARARMEAEKKLPEIAMLEEQVNLQRDLVDALLEMGQAMKMAQKAAAGGGGGGADPFFGGTGGGVDISSAITAWQAKIEEFKTRISEKIDQTFKDIKTAWDTSAIGQFINRVREVFDQNMSLSERIQWFFDAVFGKNLNTETADKIAGYLTGISEGISKIIKPDQLQGMAEFAIKSEVMGKALDLVFGPASGIIGIIEKISLLYDAIKKLYDYFTSGKIPDKITLPLPFVNLEIPFGDKTEKGAGGGPFDFLSQLPETAKEVFYGKSGVVGIVETGMSDVSAKLSTIGTENAAMPWPYIENIRTQTQTAVNVAPTGIVPTVTTGMDTVVATVTSQTQLAADNNLTNLTRLSEDTERIMTEVQTKFTTSTMAIRLGFDDTTKAVKRLMDKLDIWADSILTGKVGKAIDILLEALGHQSLPPIAVGVNDITDAITNLADKALPGLTNAVNGLSRPLSPAYSGGGTYNTQISVNANVSNSQDVHELAYVIAREFNRRTNR